MDRNRQRVAIGVFATAADAAATMARLQALGVVHCECLPNPPNHAAALKEPRSATPAVGSSSSVMVRTYLRSIADEQVVVAALLESAALSVLLHDIDQSGEG